MDFVGNGLEALDAVRKVKYDAVLMDIQMPDMDGIVATRRIRALADRETSNIPIIALTANAMKGDKESYLAAGMTDYISKPIEPARLFAAILRATGGPAIDEALLAAQSPQPPKPEISSADEAKLAALLDDIDLVLDAQAEATPQDEGFRKTAEG